MARLPSPGADAGNWGKILNEFLAVEHDADGLLRRGNNPTVTVGEHAQYNFAKFANPSAAIQAAINDYAATGATVVINTSCTLTASVNPKSNIHITSTPGVIITFNSGHVAGAPTAPNSGFHAFVTTSTCSNFSLYNLRFNGGLTELTTGVDGYEYHAIYIKNGSHDFTVENIYATRTASGAVRFRDACYAFVARNISVFQADAAIICTVGCNAFSLESIRAITCFAEGLYLGSGIYNFNVTNVYAQNCGTRGFSINNDLTPDIRSGVQANVSNVQSIGSTLQGVYLTGCDEINLSNIYTRSSGRSGISLSGCNNITLDTVQAWNSNQTRATDGVGTYTGVQIYDSKRVSVLSATCDDDGTTVYQYRGINSAQSVAGATDYIRVVGGRSDNTISSAQAVIIGTNSTVTNHGGYNPDRFRDNGNVSAAPSLLLKNGNTQRIVLTQATALQTFDTNAVPGQKLTLVIVQDATGGRALTFPSNAKLLNGAWTPSTSANAIATITFEFISSSLGWYEICRAGT